MREPLKISSTGTRPAIRIRLMNKMHITIPSKGRQSLVEPFQGIYASDSWALGSGPGSLSTINTPLIELLERFIRDNSVRRIVDFGCGDWQWMSQVDLAGTEYFGFDVVAGVLAKNAAAHKSQNVQFALTPDNLSDLPEGELIVFKDVLIHLPNAYVSELLAYARQKYRFILAINNETDNPSEYNSEIEFGGFRPVDLARPPFSMRCATVLRYGKLRVVDPRVPWIIAKLFRRFVWPGMKCVQLALGDRP
jgi:SAM-dependent methyltransferase